MDGPHKQRWVGVILLLLLAAMLAPFVFRSPEQVRLSLEMEAPEPPVVAPVKPNAAANDKRVERTREQIERERAAVRESTEQATDAKPKKPGDEPPLSGWSVQVASFRDSGNARRLEQSLRDAGYNAYWREETTDNGETLFRVYVGPELQRADARELRDRIAGDEAFSLEGLVVPYSP